MHPQRKKRLHLILFLVLAVAAAVVDLAIERGIAVEVDF